MITVVYCTRESNPEHKEHLIKSSGLHKHIEVIEIINNGESLTTAYNRGLKQAKNDIVVYCHDDLTIETKQWGNKLLKQFQKNPEYGIIGVAGSKYMAESGQWWSDKNKMFGRVQHTHEGKTWLSSYSEDLGNELEEVVVVDGVFFAVDKTKLKTTFNESVEGFHFYDVTFCFENLLKGVKVGVSTVVRVNHKSIGMTNEKWESNRQQFAETFKEQLPYKIKKVLRKNEKLKVLIGCLNFNGYTGSELYVFELAKQLIKEGCEVSVCSNLGQPLAGAANKLGIKMYSLQEPPGFKLGDGAWKLKSNEGEVTSQPNTLYKLSDIKFDVIHLNHKPVTEHLSRLYPDTPMICSIHSEVVNLEEPVLSPEIKKYIAIRPEIKEYITSKFGVDSDLVSVIYNPIDSERFKVSKNTEKHDKKRILFVGTLEHLRKNPIIDLVETTKQNNQELWVVGRKHENYIDELLRNNDHVKYFEPTPNVEKYIQQCDETAGILLGRTTIEGWMCGKAGWIYDVDSYGNILSKTFHEVPSDINKFDNKTVTKQIISEYLNAINQEDGILYKDDKLKLTTEEKLGIIIPTKGNLPLLFNCVDSIFEKTRYENFTVYIADTGSTEIEIEQIRTKYLNNDKVKLKLYDYYNFSEINNDMVNNVIDNDTELVLFCNNDIQLLNDAISKMVNVYQTKDNCGTVGCRLHFKNGLIQHGGIIIHNVNDEFRLTHKGLNTKYGYNVGVEHNKWGCTGAFLLINVNIFKNLNGFTKTNECFEDVILNLNTTLNGYDNYFVGDAVCYHLESQTRKNNVDKNKREYDDYKTFLLPILIKNKNILFKQTQELILE
jgi:GT2 family glycosyltransferase/glycosyltransferase involved in cell wall biosynthesis